MSALVLTGATAEIGGRAVLAGVSAAFEPGLLHAVVGPNGAGKTTLLRVAAGLAPLVGGRAELLGEDVRRLSPAERARRLSYLPQDRRPAWGMPAAEIAALGVQDAPPEAALRRAREALADVGLAGLEERGVFDMSGGERARALLARALAARAPALLLDEPVAGLDPDAGLRVMALARREAERGACVLVALHDLGLAARTCDRVLVLQHGRTVADGPPVQALAPAVLREVFDLDAAWIEGPYGPLLAARRAQ